MSDFIDAFWGSTRGKNANTIKGWYRAIQEELRNPTNETMCFGSLQHRKEALEQRAALLNRAWLRRRRSEEKQMDYGTRGESQ